MAEVTYYVALPFLAADDGVAAGEPLECFNPNAAERGLYASTASIGGRVPGGGVARWSKAARTRAPK
ncbi:hypothetical protein ACQR1N_25555 [Bradyrhizobium sp. HKCCYLRH1073]|uniref:hypothetical protein n=1 Tax=unclassified Bradyrhizobium TaxID=2631580 RepID=UPI003EB6CF3A